MQPIRISLDLLKFQGARLVRMNNAQNVPTDYVCIPVRDCFVPSNDPRPYLMATMIHCPNAQYGNFMIKPYLSPQDYATKSKEEREAVPVCGKGTFIESAANQAITKVAERVESTELDPTQLVPSESKPRPAAPLGVAPSPAEGGQTPNAAAAEAPAAPAPEAPLTYYPRCAEGYGEGQTSWEAAAFIASGDNSRWQFIEAWNGNQCVHKWRWDEAQITWVKNF